MWAWDERQSCGHVVRHLEDKATNTHIVVMEVMEGSVAPGSFVGSLSHCCGGWVVSK